MTRHYISYSERVDVDVYVPIDKLDDDEIRAVMIEAGKRGLTQDRDYERDYAEEAYRELIGGRPNSALALLERALHPTKTEKAA